MGGPFIPEFFGRVRHAAVAVMHGSPFHCHAGVLYRDADGFVRVLHLAFQRELVDEIPREDWVYFTVDAVDELEEEQIPVLCEIVWHRELSVLSQTRAGSIAYAFRYANA